MRSTICVPAAKRESDRARSQVASAVSVILHICTKMVLTHQKPLRKAL